MDIDGEKSRKKRKETIAKHNCFVSPRAIVWRHDVKIRAKEIIKLPVSC